jgi:AMP nucleosidase
METATLFSVAFANKIPIGALLLVSDQPMVPDGVKTEESDQEITRNFVDLHLKIGIDALREIKNEGRSIRHLRWD